MYFLTLRRADIGQYLERIVAIVACAPACNCFWCAYAMHITSWVNGWLLGNRIGCFASDDIMRFSNVHLFIIFWLSMNGAKLSKLFYWRACPFTFNYCNSFLNAVSWTILTSVRLDSLSSRVVMRPVSGLCFVFSIVDESQAQGGDSN